MIKRKVLYAKLHQTVHLPSVGELTATLPPSLKNYSMVMVSTPEGIEIDLKDRFGKAHLALVPWGNVAISELGQVVEDIDPVSPVKAKSSVGK